MVKVGTSYVPINVSFSPKVGPGLPGINRDTRIYLFCEVIFRHRYLFDSRGSPGTLDYAEQQRWLEHRRQVFTPEFLQGYADELQMLVQQYADDKEKVALLKALWQYAEEIV